MSVTTGHLRVRQGGGHNFGKKRCQNSGNRQERYKRPLCEWSWELREQRMMWQNRKTVPWPCRVTWTTSDTDLNLGTGKTWQLPPLPGFHLDCLATTEEPCREGPSLRMYYRPELGQASLGVFLYHDGSPPPLRKGPLYHKKTTRILGRQAAVARAVLAGSSRVDVDLEDWRLVVSIPPPNGTPLPDQDLRLAGMLARSFSGMSRA